MSKVIELTKDSFKEEVLDSNIPVLVDFWAPWCQPCLMMAPILEEVAEEMVEEIKIAKLNTAEEENEKIAMEYEIQSIPNMKLFKNGEVVREYIGLKDKKTLVEDLKSNYSG